MQRAPQPHRLCDSHAGGEGLPDAPPDLYGSVAWLDAGASPGSDGRLYNPWIAAPQNVDSGDGTDEYRDSGGGLYSPGVASPQRAGADCEDGADDYRVGSPEVAPPLQGLASSVTPVIMQSLPQARHPLLGSTHNLSGVSNGVPADLAPIVVFGSALQARGLLAIRVGTPLTMGDQGRLLPAGAAQEIERKESC